MVIDAAVSTGSDLPYVVFGGRESVPFLIGNTLGQIDNDGKK